MALSSMKQLAMESEKQLELAAGSALWLAMVLERLSEGSRRLE